MLKVNGHSALPVAPDGFAWESCHPSAVTAACPRSHIITFLALFGPALSAGTSAVPERIPCEFSSARASETSPGEDRLYLGKQNNRSSCVCPGKAWRKEEREEREGQDKEPRRGRNYKVFALVAKPAGDDLPLLLF